MNKVVLIGWSIMLAAFVYATRELQASQTDGFSIIVARQEQARTTSSNFRAVIPKHRQSGPSLHKRNDQKELLTSARPLGCNCKNKPSVFHGSEVKVDVSKSKFRQNIKQAILASYGQGTCPEKF